MTERIAEVLFKDKVAGRLEETPDGGSRFTYGREWREPIACAFPTEQREYLWRPGLQPFFEHLAPEGWLRERQARGAQISQQDDFGLLLRYGADCIGAVGLRPTGPPPAPAQITEAALTPGRTVSGVQKKLLAVKEGKAFRPAERSGPAPYIAKFNSETIPTLVRNEALSLRWTAAVLGAEEVNAFAVAEVEGQGPALVVTRFDRDDAGNKFRLEDFAQILNKPRGRDYGGKYDGAYEDIAAAIQKYSSRPAIDVQKFFRRLAVYCLVGNCDAHLKNFSLLETPSGLRLSPVYDVVNSTLYPDFQRELALSLGGRRIQIEAVTRAILADFGGSIGLPAKAISQVFDELARKTRAAASHIQPPPGEPPDGFVHRYAETVSNACLRILPQ